MSICEVGEFAKFSQEKMGKKWQMIERSRCDIFQNIVLCQLTFHCNFRLYKLRHKIPEVSEWNVWIFFSSGFKLSVISLEQKCPDVVKKVRGEENQVHTQVCCRGCWREKLMTHLALVHTTNLGHRGGRGVRMW